MNHDFWIPVVSLIAVVDIACAIAYVAMDISLLFYVVMILSVVGLPICVVGTMDVIRGMRRLQQ